MKKATITDVANRAGVSRVTVYRVINGQKYVSDEKSTAVLKAIEDLNYSPNRAAQALATRKKHSIAIIYPTAEWFFWREIQDGIDAAAREYENSGLSVVRYPVEKFDLEMQKKALQQACEKGIDGLAIAPAHASKLNSLIADLSDNDIPVVTFNHDAPRSRRIAYVGQDLARSGALAADLLALFLRDRGTVAILKHRAGTLERESGFTNKLGRDYPKIEIVGRFNYRQSEKRAYQLTQKVCSTEPPPDALYVTSATVFMVGRAVQDMGLSERIRIAGFDTAEETQQLVRDGVIDAVIRQEPFRQGYEPVRILHDVLYKDSLPADRLLYTKSEIIVMGNA